MSECFNMVHLLFSVFLPLLIFIIFYMFVKAVAPGRKKDADPNDAIIQQMAQFAVSQMDERSNSLNKQKLVVVKKARTQVIITKFRCKYNATTFLKQHNVIFRVSSLKEVYLYLISDSELCWENSFTVLGCILQSITILKMSCNFSSVMTNLIFFL